jgi:hypothetical protein
MKTTQFALVPLLGAALLLSACSTIDSRINEKSSVFYNLDADARSKIAHGDVSLGFTPDMVYMALGNPDVKRQRTTADGTAETWIYRTYYDHFDGGPYVGYHRWGGWNRGYYRMYWEPVYHRQASSDDIRVTFRGGKVTAIDQARS